MIDQNSKNKILSQIDKFREDEIENTGKDVYKYRYYVEPEIAIDRARFFKFIHIEKIKKKLKYENVIDLTFGSGSLTSHILLDNDLEFSKLVLNDKNIDDANFSDELGEIAEDIVDNNILNPNSFTNSKQFDLVIFNPQIGGKDRTIDSVKTDGYKKGMLIDSIPTQLSFSSFGGDPLTALSEYVDLLDCIVCIDDNDHSIRIHSTVLSKKEMDNRYEKLKIFNYYDIFYQGKKGKEEGSCSDIVKFRINIEKITKHDTVIAFMGDDKEFDSFFHEFNVRYVYNTEKGKSFVIGLKGTTNEKTCYKNDANNFIEIDCDQKYQFQQIDLDEALNEIHKVLSDLKSLDGGELFLLKDKDGIQTSSETKEVKPNDTKPAFKNFLLDYIVKETK